MFAAAFRPCWDSARSDYISSSPGAAPIYAESKKAASSSPRVCENHLKPPVYFPPPPRCPDESCSLVTDLAHRMCFYPGATLQRIEDYSL